MYIPVRLGQLAAQSLPEPGRDYLGHRGQTNRIEMRQHVACAPGCATLWRALKLACCNQGRLGHLKGHLKGQSPLHLFGVARQSFSERSEDASNSRKKTVEVDEPLEVLKLANRCRLRKGLHCQLAKSHRNVHMLPEKIFVPNRHFAPKHIDLVCPHPQSAGNTHILTIVDRSSRWPEAVPLSCTTPHAIAEGFLQTWVARFSNQAC